MKNHLFTLSIVAIAFFCATCSPKITAVSAPNTLTQAEIQDGWKLLFNGTDMNDFRNFKKQTIGTDWTIDPLEHAIYLNAQPRAGGGWQTTNGGDLITKNEYENYELQLEWKIGACGNSGIIYNVAELPKTDYVWQTGPEMQVLDNSCHPDAKIIKHRAGDLYDMISCNTETVKKQGEWNAVRLVVNQGNIEHWLNGKQVVAFKMFDDNWKTMIKGSKFKDYPFFGTIKKGHIALQDHGDKVWYRNIKIKQL